MVHIRGLIEAIIIGHFRAKRLNQMSANKRKRQDILDRIKNFEDDIAKADEFLESGANAHWHKFRAIFFRKTDDRKVKPPHRDWVKNVFIPSREKAIRKAEKLLDKME